MKNKKYKFLFVIDNLSTGGAQRQMVNLANGLIDRGHSVEIFCYTHGDLLAQPLIDKKVPIHWKYKHSRFSMDVVFNLRKLIRTGKFDLVLSFLTTPNIYAVLAAKFLKFQPVPVVVSERFCDLPSGIGLIDRAARQLYRGADNIVSNSYHQTDNLKKTSPWLKERCLTIYNGYDLDVFSPTDHEPNNHPMKILAIASVSPYKNGMCLVDALNILNNQFGLNLSVDWIGQLVLFGDRLDYLNLMNEMLKKYDLESNWHWLNQRSDIVEQLHSHDVLVHPSFGEGLPNVVCEALACARPVILSDTLDHKNLVQEGVNGLLFNYQDPSELADKIVKFCNLPIEDRRIMGTKGRQIAEANLSKERLTDDYEKVFLSILEKEE
jgi:glycosyltransferase involved in cell wall biosynthesis